MLNTSASPKALKMLFRRLKVVDIDKLSQTLQTKSRMSIFRRLKEIGYFSSYTHTGRYYTLAHIPQFDDYGLWFYQGIGFSRYDTLKATTTELVNSAITGLTHTELNHILRIQVHNTLLTLVREARIGREHFKKAFLYVNAKPDKATEQILRRQKQLTVLPKQVDPIPVTTIIEVLIEAVHAGRVRIRPTLIANRLSIRGVPITVKQVEKIFVQYGIATEKKTV